MESAVLHVELGSLDRATLDNVVHVAEVDIEVVEGQRLRLGLGIEIAATILVAVELEDHVVRVFPVLGQASSPGETWAALEQGVHTLRWIIEVTEHGVELLVQRITRLLEVVGSDLAMGMQEAERWKSVA